ncbi:MAG: TonB-dependent receptor [Sphingomonadales bacterium]|nr:MAG: TonB-dependent receptor [Sphingomonadales bacterium]
MKSISTRALLASCAAISFYGTSAFAQDTQAQDPPVAAPQVSEAEVDDGTPEIVVTARRREEALSRVPVAITALDGEMLANRSITSLDQLTQAAPGLNFGRSGGSANPQVVIRGQSRSNLGDAAQPVLTYFADVPLPYVASIIPTYDLSSVQVLKGPQGTLFGRNSTSGALLVYPTAPDYEVGGYMMAGYGNYNQIEAEGALNLPILADHIALRVAGRYDKRDGYTTSVVTGQQLDNRNDAAFRASLLLETGDLRNVTVYDHVEWDRNGDGAIFRHIYPNPAGGVITPRRPGFNTRFDCGTSASCDIDLALTEQQALGIRKNQAGTAMWLQTRATGLSNTTTLALGNITLKNVFGIRTAHQRNAIDTDGTAMGLTVAENLQNFRQISEEFQVQGSFFGDRLETIAGAFYLKSEPNGPVGLILAPFIGVAPSSVVQSYREMTSKALFGQATFDLGSGFKIDAGARHTWDETTACAKAYSASVPYTPGNTPVASYEQCRNGGTVTVPGVATPVNTQGTIVGAKSAAWTWNFGANYQASDGIFLYATARRGYRAGGVNTPILGGTLTQFQSYDPETVIDAEIGMKTKWNAGGMRGTFNIDVFRGTYKGTQRGVNGTNNNFDGDGNALTDPSGGTIIINAGKARVQGFDVDFTIVPMRGLTFAGFASYNDAKYLDTGTPAVLAAANAFPAAPNDVAFPYAPALTVGGSISYETYIPEAGTLAVNVDAYRASRVFFSPFKTDLTLSQPAYAIANLRVDLRDVGGSPLSVGLYVRNLFNKEYATGAANSATASGYNSVFYAEPRMYGIQGRVKF